MYNLLIIFATYTGLYLFAVAIRLTVNLLNANKEKRKAEQKNRYIEKKLREETIIHNRNLLWFNFGKEK